MRKKAIESLLCTGPTSSIHTHTLDPLSVRPRPKAATSAAAFTNTAGGGAFVSQIKFMAISPQLLLTFSSARVQYRKEVRPFLDSKSINTIGTSFQVPTMIEILG